MSPTPTQRIVIVGNGIAGLTAAETLREHGYTGTLTILAAEPTPPYSRPALSKSALLETDAMTTHLLPDASHRAEERFGVHATRLDTAAQLVHISEGDPLPYNGLIIASGSHAIRLSDSPHELTLRTLEDAHTLRERIAGAPAVIVLGGGPLGMEVASGCRALGCEVTLVCQSTPMHSLLGTHLGNALATAAEAAGVRLEQSPARSIDGTTVTLENGTQLTAPLIVTAIGDHANTNWLAHTGLLTDGQLRIDSRCRVITADGHTTNLVAAGDVTTSSTGSKWRRTPLWTDAIEQAKTAATTLLEGDRAPEIGFTPYFWTDQFGIGLKVCGPLPVTGEPETVDGSLAEQRALMRWIHPDGTATVVAYNYRIPLSRLRAFTQPVSTPVPAASTRPV